MKHRPYVYVPRPDDWNWKVITPIFAQLELDKAKRSHEDLYKDLQYLDDEVRKIELEIRAKWAGSSVQVMRAFETRIREVRREHGRIRRIQGLIRHRIDLVHERGNLRGWHLK